MQDTKRILILHVVGIIRIGNFIETESRIKTTLSEEKKNHVGSVHKVLTVQA